MENNENFVAEEVAENVEQTTEETVTEPAKVFTQDDLNAAVGKAKARERAKITKQFERKYGQLEEVLKTGTGKEDLGEITDTFRQHYQQRGVQFREPSYSDRDIEVLAKVEADEIISGGYEDVCEEVDRLANVGVANMTAKERAVFKVLAEHRQAAERGQALAKIGVTEDVYNSKEFSDFAAMFNPKTPIKDVYDIYRKTNQKEYKTMGSMKNHDSGDKGVKDFYTPEEARRFTRQDFDKNPALFKAVEKSMQRWKK
jgi:hypothetical protein